MKDRASQILDDKVILQALLLCGLLISSTLSFADSSDFDVLPNINLSGRQFDYVSNDNTVAGNIITAGLGLSVTYQRFYADFKAESSLSSQNNNASGLANTANAGNFRRSDFTFSTGYALENTFILFTGYKQGKTNIDIIDTANTTNLELIGKGFFIGAGAGTQIRDWGLLSFSAAYADLNAEYQDNPAERLNGNASGTSLSLSWKAPLTKHLSYQLSLIRHDYAYAGFARSKLRIQENILSLGCSLAYRF